MAERYNRQPGNRGGTEGGVRGGRSSRGGGGTGSRSTRYTQGGSGREEVGRAASGRPADGRSATGRAASGRSTDGRSATGRAASGRPADGRSATGRAASGRPAGGRSATGRAASGRPAGGRSATGRAASGRPAGGRSATGRAASGRPAGGRTTYAQEATSTSREGRGAIQKAWRSDGDHFTEDARDARRPLRTQKGRVNERSVDLVSNETAENSALVVGRHPVLEALKSGRSINKILVADSAEGGSLAEILAKAKAAGVVVQRVPRTHLDSLTPGGNHQGIVAYTAAHDYVELEEIISRKTGQDPLVLLLDEVSDPYNLGAVLRTAEATGVQGVVIPKRRAVPLTETVGKAAAGAMEYVPVARVSNLVQAMETLKEAGYWIVGTDVEGAVSYTSVPYQGPIAIVIGAEGQGLSRLVRERCDYLVALPMLGKLQSLNASVATGVLLYEVVRQRS